MNTKDRIRLLEALLCAALAQAGGSLTLTAAEIRLCKNRYRCRAQVRRRAQTVTLTVEPTTRLHLFPPNEEC
jgi:hypothetical protein